MSDKKMTPKMIAFSQHVAKGNSLADSYRKAYNAEKMTPACVRREASYLMADPRVTATVMRLREEISKAVVASGVSDVELVRDTVRGLIKTAKGTPDESVKLRACDLMAKIESMYKLVPDDKPARSPEDVRAELERRLLELEQRPAAGKLN